jgi:hypothetical protein
MRWYTAPKRAPPGPSSTRSSRWRFRTQTSWVGAALVAPRRRRKNPARPHALREDIGTLLATSKKQSDVKPLR